MRDYIASSPIAQEPGHTLGLASLDVRLGMEPELAGE